ncbi:unnamed protein product [Oncorhynchus mykiss]|uniref:Calcitonin peptide-like domain-containing protein n=1 Tax=Oncorhynchus mykiss TaxID=8022 RepID=A0A060X207_ONCMY|nr:unnamed protein product [Oncorhynchus mykiss]
MIADACESCLTDCRETLMSLLSFSFVKIPFLTENKIYTYKADVTAQKRACNTATCVTHRLADFLNRSGGMGNSNFVPTNVGAKAFGRRRRDTPKTAPM